MTAPTTEQATTTQPVRRLPRDQRPPYEPSAAIRTTIKLMARLMRHPDFNRPGTSCTDFHAGQRQMLTRWIAADSGSYEIGMTAREARVWLDNLLGKPKVTSSIPGPGDETGFRPSDTLQMLIDGAGDEFSQTVTHITRVSDWDVMLRILRFEAEGFVPAYKMNSWSTAWLKEAIVDSFMSQYKLV